MKEETVIEYAQMAKRVIKSPDEIMKTLSPTKIQVDHMVHGLVSESYEIQEALRNKDLENLIEELGDLELYLEGLFSLFGLNKSMIFIQELAPLDPTIGLFSTIVDLQDSAKKYLFYNELLRFEEIKNQVIKLESYMIKFMNFFEIPREEVLLGNMNKLEKGDNPRYKDGYSDDDARIRKDKEVTS